MKLLTNFLVVLFFWAAPLAACEPAYSSLPSELVQLRNEGRLTVRALWAWQLVPELKPAMALDFRDLGYDLLSADQLQVADWLAMSDAGQMHVSAQQRELLMVLLSWMNAGQEPQPEPEQHSQAASQPSDEALPGEETMQPQPVDSGDVMYRGGLNRTGVSAASQPRQKPNSVWKLELTKEPCRDAVVAGNTAYIGSVDGHLYAINLAKGALRWKFYAEDWIDKPPAVSAGTVYFGNAMGDKSGSRHLFAVDALSGSEKWRFKSQFYGVNSSPAIVDGTVYFGAGDYHLYALDAQTGEKKWSFKGEDSVGSPAIADGTVFFAHGNRLTAVELGADAEKWTFRTQAKISTCPVVSNGVVYVGASDDFNIYAVDAESGQEKWKFNTGLIHHPPGVHDGVVYVVSFDNLHALDAQTGIVKWKINTSRESLTAPVISEETILVGAGKFLLALDPGNGQEKWRFEAGDKITTPAVSDGGIYFWSEDGYFYTVR